MYRTLALTVAAVAVAAVASPVAATPRQAPTEQRQQQFRAAAAEFGVPERVLLGVAFLQSRWDGNGGEPSIAAGYGPMHLTDVAAANAGGGGHHDEPGEDPRGDTARKTLAPKPGALDLSAPSLRTADLAARLTGLDKTALRADPAANIRGGAALLAHYQRGTGRAGADPAAWYGAVARYSGATEAGAATAFADEVYSVLREGADRTTDDGQRVRLAATPGIRPDTGAVAALGLRTAAAGPTECPADLACDWVPAPYQQLTGADYGNHDKANRPVSAKVDYIVVHDTEASYATTLQLVQDPTYVSWHYSLRSSDGRIAQHVPTKDVAWHAGNWYVNAKAVGVEHEGFAAQGSWYTEAMYRTSAKLVRHLAAKYRVPIDRAHILGHDNVPGTVPSTVRGMHWDPGPYWDWGHYFDLMGAPLVGRGAANGPAVMVRPDFASNRPTFTGCATGGVACPARGSSSVFLRSAPNPSAPLLVDIGLRPDGSRSTTAVSDTGSRAGAGQKFAVAERSGGWTAVWYLGQKGWLPDGVLVPTASSLVTPAAGRATIPVYGRAYPAAAAYPAGVPVQEVVPLQYALSAGERYTTDLAASAEYYWTDSFDTAQTHVVVRGEKYYEIQFGHRVAFVKADDVRLIKSVR